MKRERVGRALPSAGAVAACAVALGVIGGLVSTARAATGPVTCDGTGTEVQSGLESVAGATLQDRTPVASDGPNLVLNGDFTYDDMDASQNGGMVRNGLTTDFYGMATKKDIKNWPAGGGGPGTYAAWGGGMNWFWNTGTATASGASLSMIYFGNGPSGRWHLNSGSFAFNSDGVGQGDLTLYPQQYWIGTYGTADTPVTVSQTVDGLTPGKRYRLQFFVASEDSTVTPDINTQWAQTGIAAVDITGYARTYFSVPHGANRYVTLDFKAASADTTITFANWGHILIGGPQDESNPSDYGAGATELALDDVILTECIGGAAGPRLGVPLLSPVALVLLAAALLAVPSLVRRRGARMS